MSKINKLSKRQAKKMMKRLRPLEDWLADNEAMEKVQRLGVDPVKIYEKFKDELVALFQ